MRFQTPTRKGKDEPAEFTPPSSPASSSLPDSPEDVRLTAIQSGGASYSSKSRTRWWLGIVGLVVVLVGIAALIVAIALNNKSSGASESNTNPWASTDISLDPNDPVYEDMSSVEGAAPIDGSDADDYTWGGPATDSTTNTPGAGTSTTDGNTEEGISTCPSTQYKAWSDLSAEERSHAKVLGYTEETWNLDNDATYNTIEDSDLESLTPEQRQAIAGLGYDTVEKWDCCVSHYYSYYWFELDEKAKKAFEVFGWKQTTYHYNERPEAWSLNWADLNAEQQAAAADLCYNEDTWDEDGRGANLPKQPAAESEPTFTSYDISICPPEIAEAWSDLSAEDKEFATTLGYNEKKWDLYSLPKYNHIEDIDFARLTDGKQKAAAGLGYDTVEKWDCCVNHYNSYWWNQLDDDRKVAYKFFGWTAETFDNNDDAPEDWKKDWADLTENQKAAAAVLCFNQKSWEENEALLDPGSKRRKQRMLRHNTIGRTRRTKRRVKRTGPVRG